jgi:8-oxo-dGTP pyrophosphatase MutT (NUDIX family)
VTTQEVLKATGWPSVSMPQQAKAGGLTLTKSKAYGKGGLETVYKATDPNTVYAATGSPMAASKPSPVVAAILAPPMPLTALAGASGLEKTTAWKKVGPQKGSNIGGFYDDPQGEHWYLKQPASEAYARNEVLTGKLYALAGAKVPETKLVSHNGSVSVASKLITEGKTLADLNSMQAAAAKLGAQRDFAADAWLANWDVVGLVNDNLMKSHGGNGDVYRVDHGGGMEFRAQGQPKPFLGSNVGEWETLRDPAKNPQAAAVFGGMAEDELDQSAAKVAAVKDYDIAKAVWSVYPPGSVKATGLIDTLKARRDLITGLGGAFVPGAAHNAAAGAAFAKPAPVAAGLSAAVQSDDIWSPKATEYLNTQGMSLANFQTPKKVAALSNVASATWKTALDIHNAEKGAVLPLTPSAPPAVSVAFKKGEKLPASLNNVPFSPYTAPADWNHDPGVTASTFEGKVLPTDKTISAGVAMVEPDGRVWIRKPTGGYGGYNYSWPKGGQESGLSLQGTALKEAHEETGLHAKIEGHIGDFPGSTSLTRMYVGTRIGGDPTKTDSETESVHLVTPQDAMGMFNTQRDKDILMAALLFAGQHGNTAASKAREALVIAGHKGPSVGAGGIMSKGSFMQPAAPPTPTATTAAAAKKKEPLTAFTFAKTPEQAIKHVTSYSDSSINSDYSKAQASGFPIDRLEAAAIGAYTGSTYSKINKALWADAWTPDQAVYINTLKSALNKMPKYVGVVKRGTALTPEELAPYKEGFIRMDRGFTSTSVTSPWSGNTQFTIHSLTGVHVRKLSHHANEDEVLIPAHTAMMVVSHEVKGGTHYIELQEVPKP